ncbi:MBL fold metallo-hydrolase [Prevotella dentasini]|uniref:MBL fold metallo-hydrolase n=1 Tax=Prevotella dentasini TaxID=589537 RepID=UPI0004699C88|nr:MBL fold metallo-hydrolase [Prevotella dentasini]
MLNIQKFPCNMLSENCYVVSDETSECVIIDCGAYYEEERRAVTDYIRTRNLRPVHLLCTHGHLDHNFGNNTIYEAFGLRPEAAPGDDVLMENMKAQAREMFQIETDYDFPAVDHYFAEGETVSFGSHKMDILRTPGHTPGSVVFHCPSEHAAFTGDTLFKGSIGRTDFPGGSMFQIISSLRQLCMLPDETAVYPGHGPKTDIGFELAHNPYMDR